MKLSVELLDNIIAIWLYPNYNREWYSATKTIYEEYRVDSSHSDVTGKYVATDENANINRGIVTAAGGVTGTVIGDEHKKYV